MVVNEKVKISECLGSALQRSFRKTGTMETLASQTEIDVWGAAGALLRRSRLSSPLKIFLDFICKMLQSDAILAGNGSQYRPQCVLKTLTMGTVFPRVPLEMSCGAFVLPHRLTVVPSTLHVLRFYSMCHNTHALMHPRPPGFYHCMSHRKE